MSHKRFTSKKLIVSVFAVTFLAIVGVYVAYDRHMLVLGKQTPPPAGWSLKYSQNCNLDLPVPPNKQPYQMKTPQGTRYWQEEEFSSQQNNTTNSIARVIFKYPGEQGNLVAGVVIVYCSPNNAKDTTDSYVAKFEKKLGTDPTYKGITITSKKTETYWGRKVVHFIAKAPNGDLGEYFFFASKEHIYLVRPQSQLKDQTVRDTAKKIFLNLQFHD